jgi:hypothetical protein
MIFYLSSKFQIIILLMSSVKRFLHTNLAVLTVDFWCANRAKTKWLPVLPGSEIAPSSLPPSTLKLQC